MTLRLVSERKLESDEIRALHEAATLLKNGHNRREVLKIFGLAGVLTLGPLWPTPADAYVSVFVRLVKVWGPVGIGAAIPASFELFN